MDNVLLPPRNRRAAPCGRAEARPPGPLSPRSLGRGPGQAVLNTQRPTACPGEAHVKRNLGPLEGWGGLGKGSHSAGPRSPTSTDPTQSASHVPPLSPQTPFKGSPSRTGGGLGVQRRVAATLPTLAGLGVDLTLFPSSATHRAIWVPSRERVLSFVTRGWGWPLPPGQGPFPCSRRQRWARRRKKIKPVLKEGHLAGEGKGLRNPLLWGAFKWGKSPHSFHSPGHLAGATSGSHNAPLVLSFCTTSDCEASKSPGFHPLVCPSLPVPAPCSQPSLGFPGAPGLPGGGIGIRAFREQPALPTHPEPLSG